jgi:diguanylate cyclase (GGDEF)-like protein
LSNKRTLAAAGLLWLIHIGVVVTVGTQGVGPLLSDALQLVLGSVLIYAINDAGRRSEGLARSFWRLAAVAYLVWFVAQGLSVYNDWAHSEFIAWAGNLLFSFWFAPLAMAIFLDPETASGTLDSLIALDFVQAVLICLAAYLYFFYLPRAGAASELAHEVWAPYFGGYAFVALTFLLRAGITHSRDSRALFGKMGILLGLSGGVDASYYYGPGRNLETGAWFDILWSFMLLLPVSMAATWKQLEWAETGFEPPKRDNRVFKEVFFLLYPLLVLFMSLRIARERLGLAAAVVFLSFVCSSARMLLTQHRLVLAQDALRREAARDGLTSLWNRKAILEIFERELQRSERDHQPVGVIMADIDHFKQINDSRGHAAGDTVLRIIASGIAAVVRPYDSVGRYGGEEFLVVAPGCGVAETWELAERIRAHVAGCEIVVGGSPERLTLSLGITVGHAAADSEKLLQAADAALYQAKNDGRNRVAPQFGKTANAVENQSPAAKSDFWL